MYRPQAYAIDNVAALHAFMGKRIFATIAGLTGGDLLFAYAPVVVDAHVGARGGVRFHLARGNPLAQCAGARLHFSFLGPDAYISPDWYAGEGFVPTWNYVAVEGVGVAKALADSELRTLLVDLSAQEERRLRPKWPWTIDKLPEAGLAALLNGIRGFAVAFDTLEGKFKLSQDKKPADLAGAIAGLEARGESSSHAVAGAMRAHRDASET